MKGFLLLMEKEYADMSTYVKLIIIRLILIKRGGVWGFTSYILFTRVKTAKNKFFPFQFYKMIGRFSLKYIFILMQQDEV